MDKYDKYDQFKFDGPGFPEDVDFQKLRSRAMAMQELDLAVTAMNKRVGIAEMTPKFAADLGINQSETIKNYDEFAATAVGKMAEMCVNCTIHGCPIKYNLKKWIKEHPEAPKRHRFVKKTQKQVVNLIQEPCVKKEENK